MHQRRTCTSISQYNNNRNKSNINKCSKVVNCNICLSASCSYTLYKVLASVEKKQDYYLLNKSVRENTGTFKFTIKFA